jgi:hypothetical protein
MNPLSNSCFPTWVMRGAIAAVAVVSLQAALISPVLAQAVAVPAPVLQGPAGGYELSLSWPSFGKEAIVWYGTQPAEPLNKIPTGGLNAITLHGLTPNTTYYVKLATVLVDPKTGIATVAEGKFVPFKTAVASGPAPVAAAAPVRDGPWTVLPGEAQDIGVGGASNAMWVVGTDRTLANGANVYRWGNNTWQTVPSTGAVRLDVDAQGNAWIVNNKGEVQRFDGAKWVTVPGVAASDVGVGAKGTVWSVGAPVDASGDYAIYRLDGTTWTKMPGAAVRVDVDPAGNAWVVNKTGHVFRWTGSTWEITFRANTLDKAYDVGVGADGSVFALGMNGRYYRWNGSNGWVAYEGGKAAMNVSVNATGVPFVVNTAGTIYQGTK